LSFFFLLLDLFVCVFRRRKTDTMYLMFISLFFFSFGSL
jgi:hypothetical protein